MNYDYFHFASHYIPHASMGLLHIGGIFCHAWLFLSHWNVLIAATSLYNLFLEALPCSCGCTAYVLYCAVLICQFLSLGLCRISHCSLCCWSLWWLHTSMFHHLHTVWLLLILQEKWVFANITDLYQFIFEGLIVNIFIINIYGLPIHLG